MNRTVPKILWSVATIVLAAGILLSAVAPFAWQENRRILSRKWNDILQINLLQQRALVYSSAINAYESLPSSTPLSIAQLLVPMPTGGGYEISDGTSQQLPGGWRIESKTITLRTISGHDCLAIANRLGSAVPPWVTTTINITAGNATGVLGEVTMGVDVLTRDSRNN